MFFIFNSAKHVMLNAHEYQSIKNFSFLGSDKPRMLYFPALNIKVPTIVGILKFMSREIFMFS